MYLHLYKGNPTAGGVDGSQVSEGTGLNPIDMAALDSANNEIGVAIKLALRCDAGYNTSGNTTITPIGTTAADWALSADNITYGAYGAVLTITSVVGVVNTVIYAIPKSTLSDGPINDTSVDLQIAGLIVAV